MTRLILPVVFCAELLSMSVARGQAIPAGQQARSRLAVQQKRVAEPGEFTGKPKPMPPPPTAALRQFAESKVILAADPKDATTLAPAITELTSLIRQEPRNSDFYFLRASLSCYAHANPKEVLDDITKSMSLRDPAKPGPYPTL